MLKNDIVIDQATLDRLTNAGINVLGLVEEARKTAIINSIAEEETKRIKAIFSEPHTVTEDTCVGKIECKGCLYVNRGCPDAKK